MGAKIVNQYGSIEIDKQVISQVAYKQRGKLRTSRIRI